jgi:tetratricopeptide (TPR) repeat protein
MVLSRMRNIALALAACLAFAAAQDKPAGKVAKDQAEAALINSIPSDTDANHRLASLDKWTKDYPDTAFSEERQMFYLMTYQQLNRAKDAFNMATGMLKTDPTNELALRTIISLVSALNPPGPAELDTAEKASNYVMSNIDTLYDPAKKTANFTDAQWTQLKPAMKVSAQRTIGWIYLTRKDNEKAEAELTKTLQLDPTQAIASYWLGLALFAQRTAHPEKQVEYIFETVRAAEYDGPNGLPAATRQQLLAAIGKIYNQYHGSNDGYNDVIASAKANSLPPAGFTIASTADLAAAKMKADQEAAAANPAMALWRTIKTGLTGDNPDAFFEMNVKDTEIPGGAEGVMKFKAKIVSITPAMRPKELVLAFEKPDVADVTLKLDEALPGKMEPGSEIEFEGQPVAYTKAPYMLTLKVDDNKAKIVGWTGKNPAPARKAAPKKAQ